MKLIRVHSTSYCVGVAMMDDKALIEFVFSLEINHIEVLYTAEETKFLGNLARLGINLA